MQNATVTLRLPAEVLKRAEDLIPQISKKGPLQATRVTRSVVIRLALLRGLKELEQGSELDLDG